MTEYIELFKEAGLPTVVIFALGYTLWKAMNWAAPIVAEFKNKHFEFMERTAATQEGIKDNMRSLADSFDALTQSQAAKLDEMHADIKAIKGKVVS